MRRSRWRAWGRPGSSWGSMRIIRTSRRISERDEEETDGRRTSVVQTNRRRPETDRRPLPGDGDPLRPPASLRRPLLHRPGPERYRATTNPTGTGWVRRILARSGAVRDPTGGWRPLRPRGTLTRIVLAWSALHRPLRLRLRLRPAARHRFLFAQVRQGAFPTWRAQIAVALAPRRRRPAAGRHCSGLWRGGACIEPHHRRADDPRGRSPGRRGPSGGRSPARAFADASAGEWTFWASGLSGVVWVVRFWLFFLVTARRKNEVGQPPRSWRLIREGTTRRLRTTTTMPREVWRPCFATRSCSAMGVFYLCGSFGWSFFASWIRGSSKTSRASPSTAPNLTTFPFFVLASCLVGGTLCDDLVKKTGPHDLPRHVPRDWVPRRGDGLRPAALCRDAQRRPESSAA